MGRYFLPVLIFGVCGTLTAKNLTGRFGIGGTLHDFRSTTSLSARLQLTQLTGVGFLAGFDTSDTSNLAVFGAKVLRNAHLEENLNFYVGVGGYVISDKLTGTVATGWELDGLLGVEFFFSGLPNLGFMIETGVALRTIRAVSFKTLATGLANIGFHYYF